MAKRRAGSQTASLTPDHKKSRIDPQKVKNRPLPDVRFESATRRWKALEESYNFSSDRIAIQGLIEKLWGSKVAGVPFGAISGLSLGSPGKNSHLDVAFVESCRVYYKGEGGGFP